MGFHILYEVAQNRKINMKSMCIFECALITLLIQDGWKLNGI